ncbi:MAG TPA: hypothetical protein VL326_20230 [Kofleriaceae bacterium]|nr:hypothetical protein [Kofleriaceae bacterium]
MKKLALVALVLAACSSGEDEEDYSELDDIDAIAGKADGFSSWEMVGTGVAFDQVNTGHAVLIAYGGYTAKLSETAAWATELVDEKLGAADVGYIFAVRGPADPGYAAREIANTKLRAKLATFDDGTAPIYIVAHSSGSYVAHELLGQVNNANHALLGRMSYANLDGGGSGLSSTITNALAHMEFVYARDPVAGLSKNAGAAMSLASSYAPHATVFEVRVPGTGCSSGAGWCLHDVVITHRPHNPSTFDLARDYTDFVNRPVTTEYLDPMLAP